jgi:hypothetical protein
MKRYYTEFPMDEFDAASDEEALNRTKAQFVYTESDTENGLPFIILRNTRPPHRPD